MRISRRVDSRERNTHGVGARITSEILISPGGLWAGKELWSYITLTARSQSIRPGRATSPAGGNYLNRTEAGLARLRCQQTGLQGRFGGRQRNKNGTTE